MRSFLAAALAALACTRLDAGAPAAAPVAARASPEPTSEETFAARRAALVAQLQADGIRDPRVLAAMRAVPRHEFVPAAARELAYEDHPLAIGEGQTISQPFIVAFMTELSRAGPGSRVLEVGTGSGYQAAVLAAAGAEVWSVEIIESLARSARATLARAGLAGRVHVRHGDGYQGWPEKAPFDAIVVTAAPPAIPPPLLAQLADGGRLVIPVGDGDQHLRVITRRGAELVEESVLPVRFVPMTGRAQDGRSGR